jgi:hypothetical protein
LAGRWRGGGGVANEVILAVVIGGRGVEMVPNVGGRTVKRRRRAVLRIRRQKLLNLRSDDSGCVSVWRCRPAITNAEDTIFLIMGTDRSRDRKRGRGKGAVPHAKGTASVDRRKLAKWRHGTLVVIVNVGTRAWHKTKSRGNVVGVVGLSAGH